MTAPVLEVTNLVKSYDTFSAVGGISLVLRPGEALGLLGPNGAGKTTTIQMLLGLTEPTRGTISYFGKNFSTHREECMQRINFVSAYNQLQTRNTVRQNLHVFSMLYGVADWKEKVSSYAALMGIEDKLDIQYWKLSSGERARANFVKAMINDPSIILMDEPTASLDPEIVATVIKTINDIRAKGVAILFTSHNMQEVARVCDRVMFLDHGKIVAADTPRGLAKKIKGAVLQVMFDATQGIVEEYLREKHLAYSLPHEREVHIQLEEKQIPSVLFDLGKRGVWITDIEVEKPTLEDVFLTIAKGGTHAFV